MKGTLNNINNVQINEDHINEEFAINILKVHGIGKLKEILKDVLGLNSEEKVYLLHYAAENNLTLLAAELLKDKSIQKNLDLQDDKGKAALDISILNNNKDILKLFINEVEDIRDFGYDFIHILFALVSLNDNKSLEILLEKNSNLFTDYLERAHSDAFEHLINKAITFYNSPDIIKILYSYGLNINTTDIYGNNIALERSIIQCNLEILKFLLSKGANVNQIMLEPLTCDDKNSLSHIIKIAHNYGSFEIVQTLSKYIEEEYKIDIYSESSYRLLEDEKDITGNVIEDYNHTT